MIYKIDTTLTDELYADFNCFTAVETKTAKRAVIISRIIINAIYVACLVAIALADGFSTFLFIYAVSLASLSVYNTVNMKKIVKKSTIRQLNKIRKTGKVPYSPTATIEFYEDKLIDISPNSRIEQNYQGLDRICVVKGRFILLYTSNIGAYIVPEEQAKAQVDLDEFIQFITQKCSSVEYY